MQTFCSEALTSWQKAALQGQTNCYSPAGKHDQVVHRQLASQGSGMLCVLELPAPQCTIRASLDTRHQLVWEWISDLPTVQDAVAEGLRICTTPCTCHTNQSCLRDPPPSVMSFS